MASFVQISVLSIACVLVAVSGEIVHPCSDNDNACVGAWLAEHSTCSTADLLDASTLDPYALDYFFFSTPYFNVTEDRTNITIDGQNQTYVKDFFYNTETGKAVLTIFCPYIRFEGDTSIHANILGSEGFRFETHYIVAFTNMTLTTIFNDYTSAELSNSVTFPYLPIEPTFDNGDALAVAAANDPRVAKIVAEWDRVPFVATIEAFRYRGPALVDQYANFKLCRYSKPACIV